MENCLEVARRECGRYCDGEAEECEEGYGLQHLEHVLRNMERNEREKGKLAKKILRMIAVRERE